MNGNMIDGTSRSNLTLFPNPTETTTKLFGSKQKISNPTKIGKTRGRQQNSGSWKTDGKILTDLADLET
jgi:hypothetical protein